jgi:alkylated DNA repair dioxygenase AlkB
MIDEITIATPQAPAFVNRMPGVCLPIPPASAQRGGLQWAKDGYHYYELQWR